MKIKQIGFGEFGPIYIGAVNNEAMDFLFRIKEGEMQKAMSRNDLGDIDLVYGKRGVDGFGLAHIEESHPEIIPYLISIIHNGKI